MPGWTYSDAGVDIDAGDRLVDRIRGMAKGTHKPWIMGSLGGFAGLSRIPKEFDDPVLVSGTDGVGTKLKIAFATGKHDTIGEDLVAMCVNDVITTGARPLFFLDYFATGKLDVDQGAAVVGGVARGCEKADCALLGGETAELPDLYQPGEYDLAGFCVGVVNRGSMLGPERVQVGDTIVGIRSRGIHSNGYSLARKVLLDSAKIPLVADFNQTLQTHGVASHGSHHDQRLADVLLEPTPIYQRLVAGLLQEVPIHALCHVTGGGLDGNLPRVLPTDCGALVRAEPSPPPIFELIRVIGKVERPEMARTFNMGTGLAIVCAETDVDAVIATAERMGEKATKLGVVIADEQHQVRYDEGAAE